MNNKNSRIGLALSGGGIRAAVFHSGILRWLAENHNFENILHISTVSGGTLLIGLIFHMSGNKWPSSDDYINKIHPEIRSILTQVSLQWALIQKSCNPLNWIYLLSRANILAKAIESCWGIKGRLADLGLSPIWSANGTTFENGRRFRFKQNVCGDYEIGYATADNFKLSEAMAVSAAFPGLVGPLVINATEFEWQKRKNWGDAKETAEIISPPFSKLHLYDGGLYDNLGLEPLFDVGEQKIKDDSISTLLISDGGFPFQRKSVPCDPRRFLRIIEIIMDQSRSLRIRSVANYFKNVVNGGLYFQIGSKPNEKIKQYSSINSEVATQLLLQSWLEADSINRAATFPTGLKKISVSDFDLIERHGYETAKWNNLIFER